MECTFFCLSPQKDFHKDYKIKLFRARGFLGRWFWAVNPQLWSFHSAPSVSVSHNSWIPHFSGSRGAARELWFQTIASFWSSVARPGHKFAPQIHLFSSMVISKKISSCATYRDRKMKMMIFEDSMIFEQSWKSREVPPEWKLDKVMPKKEDPRNYRSVSLTQAYLPKSRFKHLTEQ